MPSEASTVKDESSEQKTERLIGNLVRMMVIGAAGIVALGGALYLYRYGRLSPGYRVFQSEPPSLRSLHGIFAGALTLDARGLLQLGILLLIAIPIIRVTAFILSFLGQRDWLYSLISVVVLGVLLFSFLKA